MRESLRDQLLKQEPLLPLIEEAIERFRRQETEPVRDPDGRVLEVEEDQELGFLKVYHDGRVVYRSRRVSNPR